MENSISHPFIFGIGSQRAGSTFVANLLNAIPNGYVHPIKELHYFDSKYGVRNPQVLESFCKERLRTNIEGLTDYHGAELLPLITDQIVSDFKLMNDPTCQNHDYSYHFQAIVNRRNNISYLCESTPEYMLLPSVALAEIKSVVPHCKAILAVRNPIERFISAFRLLAAHESFRHESHESLSNRVIDMIERNDGWIEQQDRFNQYKLAIANFEQAGIPVFVIHIDSLSSALYEVVRSLESFLEIDLDHAVINELKGKKINEVDFEFTPTDELMGKLKQRYETSEYALPAKMTWQPKIQEKLRGNWNLASLK
jgi:hypothetical protein